MFFEIVSNEVFLEKAERKCRKKKSKGWNECIYEYFFYSYHIHKKAHESVCYAENKCFSLPTRFPSFFCFDPFISSMKFWDFCKYIFHKKILKIKNPQKHFLKKCLWGLMFLDGSTQEFYFYLFLSLLLSCVSIADFKQRWEEKNSVYSIDSKVFVKIFYSVLYPILRAEMSPLRDDCAISLSSPIQK